MTAERDQQVFDLNPDPSPDARLIRVGYTLDSVVDRFMRTQAEREARLREISSAIDMREQVSPLGLLDGLLVVQSGLITRLAGARVTKPMEDSHGWPRWQAYLESEKDLLVPHFASYEPMTEEELAKLMPTEPDLPASFAVVEHMSALGRAIHGSVGESPETIPERYVGVVGMRATSIYAMARHALSL